MLMSGDATTTICHRYTPHKQLRLFTQNADILVVATGIPGLITADMVKKDAVVIDIGITEVQNTETGKRHVIGDVDFKGTFYCFAVYEVVLVFSNYNFLWTSIMFHIMRTNVQNVC